MEPREGGGKEGQLREGRRVCKVMEPRGGWSKKRREGGRKRGKRNGGVSDEEGRGTHIKPSAVINHHKPTIVLRNNYIQYFTTLTIMDKADMDTRKV